MRKIITATLALAAVFGVNAADRVVYADGQLSEGYATYGWWNCDFNFAAANPDGEGNVFSFKAGDNGVADASMGIMANSIQTYTGPLNSATLSFKWYATAADCTYTIRVTATAEQDYKFTTTEENIGKWNTTTVSVAEAFPTVAQQWKDFDKKGEGYVFGLILSNGKEGAEIYFSDIEYTNIDETWKAPEIVVYPAPTSVPVPTQEAADVVSLFGSSYQQATAFNIGGWGQSTKVSEMDIDGQKVMKLDNFNYLGWEFINHIDVTGYDYMHVDWYTPDGTSFGFTPISPGNEKGWVAPEVKKQEWNSYDAPLSYFSNVDFSDLFQVKFDNGNGCEGYIANVYFWKKQGGETPGPVEPIEEATYIGSVTSSHTQNMGEGDVEYPYSLNYSVTYNEDKTLTVKVGYEWVNNAPVGAVDFGFLIINGAETQLQPIATRAANYTQEGTTTATYEAGQALTLIVKKPVALGDMLTNINYTVGEDNVKNGVEAINEAAEVQFYTLDGVRVANPENGIYIKRQGSKVSKIMVR